MKNPKFSIGETVVATVSVRGSREPSMCSVGMKMMVEGIEKCGDTYKYICGYDGYELYENQLLSVEEYREAV